MKIKHLLFTHFVLFLLFFAGFSLTAQTVFQLRVNQPPALVINAGPDRQILTGSSTELGGNPTATGGTGTLTYLWQPSSYLSGDAIPNPVSQPESDLTYILSVSDQNGCISRDTITLRVSDHLSIGGITDQQFVELFPNPNTGSFSLHVRNESSSGINLCLFDITGKPIYMNQYEALPDDFSIKVNIPDLPAGYYILRIEGEFGNVYRNMIVK